MFMLVKDVHVHCTKHEHFTEWMASQLAIMHTQRSDEWPSEKPKANRRTPRMLSFILMTVWL